MPWTNQSGGGGWQGGGNRGPWSQGPSGGGSGGQPPNLEELLRRGQERLRHFFPKGLGGAGIVLIAATAFGLWLLTGFYVVKEGEQGVETRFGAYSQLTNQGLNYHLPYPIENVRVLSVAGQRSTEIGELPQESLMLTGDENIVDVTFNVNWDIKDAPAYVFNVRDPEGTVKAVAESAMREAVGQGRIDLLQTEKRKQTAAQTKALMQQILDSYNSGIRVQEVNMQRANPPEAVIADFQDVQAAKTEKDSLVNQANAYRNKVLPEARGEAESIRQKADAYKEQTVAEAQGEAQRFLAILGQYRVAKDVTRRRLYIETMERVLGGTNKVVLDSKTARGVLPYLPLPKPGEADSKLQGGGN